MEVKDFEMAVLKKVCDLTRRDQRLNVVKQKDLDIQLKTVERSQKRRLTYEYFGHVTRISRMSISTFRTYSYSSGCPERGRARKSEQRTQKTIAIVKASTNLAGDRNT